MLPDIVAGGLPSLQLSMRWHNRVLAACPLVLIAVQDGMDPSHLAPIVGPGTGIFLGGSTEWKLSTMAMWGEFCAARGIYYHVARVNTRGRCMMALAAGADSVDGSNGTRFAKNVPIFDTWSRQPDMLSPRIAV